VVTEISPLLNYFPAEKYHQEYFENNPMQPYCAYVVAPKVEKAEDLFGDLFKR
jgi:peptide-methionine (S)-S-oxide reductase